MSRIPDAELPAAEGSTGIYNNLHRALANNLALEKLFGDVGRAVHIASHLPTRTRELAILGLLVMLREEAGWAQHFQIAQVLGVSAKEARAVRDRKLGGFSASEQAAILFTEAVDQCRVTDDLWADTARHFNDVQMLDLVMLAGFYGYSARVTLALGVEIDEGLTGIDES